MNNSSPSEKTGKVALPKWFLADLPAHLPHSTISYAEGEFHFDYDASSHATVEAAYDHAQQFKDKVQVKLDASLNGHGGHFMGEDELAWMFRCDPDPETKRSRLLMSDSTEATVEGYAEDYEKWITETTPQYDANPDDFVTAHQWLSSHPAFWVKGSAEKSFGWDMDNGLRDVAVNVWRDEDSGKPVVFLEHGIHREDYVLYYHDDRIFSKAETFEDAIILMAKKVRKTYTLDGTERTEAPSSED